MTSRPELPGDVDGLVARHVVDEDDPVDEVVRDVGVGPLERPRGVVGGHDDDDARARARVGRSGADGSPVGASVGVERSRAEAYRTGCPAVAGLVTHGVGR